MAEPAHKRRRVSAAACMSHATYIALATRTPPLTHAQYLQYVTAQLPQAAKENTDKTKSSTTIHGRQFKSLAAYTDYFAENTIGNTAIKPISVDLPSEYGDAQSATIVALTSALQSKATAPTRHAIEKRQFEHDERQMHFQRSYVNPETKQRIMLPKCVFGNASDDDDPGNGCCVSRVGYMRSNISAYLNEPLCMELSMDQQARFDAHGEIPHSTPVCILCRRFYTERVALQVKLFDTSVSCVYQESMCYVDVPGGYKRSECVMPSAKNGLIGPIVKFDPSKLEIVNYVVDDVLCWVVDQRSLSAVF